MIAGIVASKNSGGAGPPPALPTTIGEPFGGGYYIGDITVADGGADDGTYAVIMGGPESQAPTTLSWKNPRSDNPGTYSETNGRANTLSMQADDPVTHYAGMYCLSYGGGGYDDWYLAAKDELNLAWTNIAALSALAVNAGYYWSSTEFSADYSRLQDLSTGQQSLDRKDRLYRVRPVRRLLRAP